MYHCKQGRGLSNSNVTYKKILTTPEGYIDKFKKATCNIWPEVLDSYYLLIDECERMIQDSDYRDRIVEPFEDFFTFKDKGLISATTLPFSEPRLSDFTHIVLKPLYDHCKPLKLIHTNSIVSSLKEYFKLKDASRYFIFLSSIETTKAVIDTLGIKSAAKLHCSENAVKGLQHRGFVASSAFYADNFAKFNFFTSRFYSGLDIELDYQPDLLLLTDVNFASHSTFDPQTEVIQICGRFRNGYNSVTHITSTNNNITFKNDGEAKVFMDGVQLAYKELIKLKTTLEDEGARHFIGRTLEEVSIAKYFNSDGSYRWCLLDNYIQEERVRGMYINEASISKAYSLVSSHFNVSLDRQTFIISDSERLVRAKEMSKDNKVRVTVEQMDRITHKLGYYLGDVNAEKNSLKEFCPIAVEAYEKLGREQMIELEYSYKEIKAELDRKIKRDKLTQPELLKAIYSTATFQPTKVRPHDIIQTLNAIYHKFDIRESAKATHIKRWFEAELTTSQSVKVYILSGRKFDI